MINRALLGSKAVQSIYKNHYLTSVRRNRLKSLKVVEGSPDKSLQTDQPLIFISAVRDDMNNMASQEGSPDKSLQTDQPLIFVSALRDEMNNKASQGRKVLQTI
ncbi:hypothetical protein T07_3231 [Trichinella nelsoni]|uniref:Uncharacterized protein n=1 Tax=Trichinella nelsoni TaxID=6336 RepID=A0A0V0RCE5_9BILA|nr:hypothetical protein T07_3231 [Trichinella nelsoni]